MSDIGKTVFLGCFVIPKLQNKVCKKIYPAIIFLCFQVQNFRVLCVAANYVANTTENPSEKCIFA